MLLARSTIDIQLHVDGIVRMSFTPGNVSRAKQRDRRDTKRSVKMAWPRIGRDQCPGLPDQRLGQPQTQGLFDQRHNPGVVGQDNNLTGLVTLRRTTNYNNRQLGRAHDLASQFRKQLTGPVLRRTERTARIETDVVSRPEHIALACPEGTPERLVRLGNRQAHLAVGGLASECFG